MRLVITGGCKTGKTTLAMEMFAQEMRKQNRVQIRSTDITQHLPWSEASAEVSKWFDIPDYGIIEGVAIPRAIRKWLVQGTGKPCDRIIFLEKTHTTLSPGQISMNKGVHTVWREIRDELLRRGVEISYK